MRLAPDPDRLVERGEDAVTFRSHVRRVDAAMLRRLGGERDQLLRRRIRRGRVLQRRGNADGPLLHRLAHQSLHPIELRRARLPVVVAEHHAADLRR
ncbi:MAG: hypothetical protein DMG04_25215, partial [Acidobacteria bacterium]